MFRLSVSQGFGANEGCVFYLNRDRQNFFDACEKLRYVRDNHTSRKDFLVLLFVLAFACYSNISQVCWRVGESVFERTWA